MVPEAVAGPRAQIVTAGPSAALYRAERGWTVQIAMPTGLGAILAVIVLIIVLLALFGAIVASPQMVLVMIGLLAIARLT